MRSSRPAWPDLSIDSMDREAAVAEVSRWEKRLWVLLRNIRMGITSPEVRELLVLRGELRRVGPELISELKTAESGLQESGRRLGGLVKEVAMEAMKEIDLQSWKEKALKLLEMAEELPDPHEEACLSKEVLGELDEADLVIEGAGQLGYEARGLRRALEDCNKWVSENRDLFLHCGQDARRKIRTFWRELPSAAPDLYRTTWKFEKIADELKLAGKEVAFEGQESLQAGRPELR